MLYAILDERAPVSPAMALRLPKLFGTSPESWLNMQRDYDLRMLEKEMSKELKKIERLRLNPLRGTHRESKHLRQHD